MAPAGGDSAPDDPFAGLTDPPAGEWTIYVQYGSSGGEGSRSGSGTLVLDPENGTLTLDVTDFPDGAASFAFNSEDHDVDFEGDPDFVPFDADDEGEGTDQNAITFNGLEDGTGSFAAGGGGGDFEGSWDLDGITNGFQSGDFVAGEPTSIADIMGLNAGDVSADYVGSDFNLGFDEISITVDFGELTWTGEFDREDGGFSDLEDFAASGTVVGPDFSGNVTGATVVEGSLTDGTVEGTLFGAGAAEMGGRYEVNFINTEGSQTASDIFEASLNGAGHGGGETTSTD